MRVRDVKTRWLKPYLGNPREIDSAVAATAESIRRYGFLNPIVADADLQVICGHTRLAAAGKLGLETVPVIIAKGLTEAQVRELRIADNATHELSSWDAAKLEHEVEALLETKESEMLDLLDLPLFDWAAPDDEDAEVELGEAGEDDGQDLDICLADEQSELVRRALAETELPISEVDPAADEQGLRLEALIDRWDSM